MAPGNPAPNPPAQPNGAGANQKEGGQGSTNTPLPRYVIPLSELRLKKWLEEAKPGDRIDISSLTITPPPVEAGAVRVTEETTFFNFRVRFIKEKATLVIKSGGFVITTNPLKGIRVYKDKKALREYDGCWSSILFSMFNKVLSNYGYNTFSERWNSVSLPNTDKNVRRLVALIASLINDRINELRDPLFSGCINPPSKTP